MASTNRYNSFTITQAFLGAPLNFEPALGSKELEDLIDLYVIGSASKQNKLSEVTLDFYNNATVDLNTGALVRTYTVLPSANTFEQSPASQYSGSSPVFTTSPGSSANFGDSGYGSFSASMTPPTNARARVTKKPRKETKKEAEIRLPGFSIMTKDGIDVTSSAGRGTKTKEQREHAHLMRIMKACADCKRKKIRCDPSHRRSQDMSRTSTSNTKSSSSSSHPKPSPPSTMPSLTPQTSYASGSTPSFSPSNAIDDFVLFPEDTWNTDMSLAGLETQDLGQFNFDINDLNQFPQDSSFDFSDPQFSNFQFNNNFGHTPPMVDPYGLDQWASSLGGETSVYARPHSSAPTRDSGGLDSSFQTSWLYDVSDVSPTTNSLAQGYFGDGSLRQPEVFQNATANASPLSSSSDWSLLESSLNTPASQETSTPASSQSPDSTQIRTRKRRAASDDGNVDTTLPLANQPGSGSGIEVNPSDLFDLPKPGGFEQSIPVLPGHGLRQRSAMPALQANGLRPVQVSSVESIAAFADSFQSTGDALTRLQSAPIEATALRSELQRLQTVLRQVPSGLPSTVLRELPTLASRLQVISDQCAGEAMPDFAQTDAEVRPEYLRECQVQARRIVRSLCATINSIQAQNSGTSSATDGPMLTSGRNVHLFAPESDSSPSSPDSGVQMWVESTNQWQLSTTGSSAGLIYDTTAGALQRWDSSSGDVVGNFATADGSLASSPSDHQRQPLPETQRGGSLDSTLLPSVPEILDLRVPIHRSYRSHAQTNGTPLDVLVASMDSALPGAVDLSPASSLSPQAGPRPTQNSASTSLLSQTSNAATTSSLAQSMDIPQDAPLVIQTGVSLGSIPSTATSYQTQTSAAHQLVLPLLFATLFGCYIASSNGVSPLSACTTPLILPTTTTTTTTTTSTTLTLTSIILATLSTAPLAYLREAASSWIGTDPLIAAIKLVFCAVITAQLPRLFSYDMGTRMGLVIMGFLSQFDSHQHSCQRTQLLSRHEEVEFAQGQRNLTPEWLVALRELSPVVFA